LLIFNAESVENRNMIIQLVDK